MPVPCGRCLGEGVDSFELRMGDGDLGKRGGVGTASEREQIRDRVWERAWLAMKSAPRGPKLPPPIQTSSVRQRPAESGSLSRMRAACIARIASSSSRSAKATAAFIASVLLTIIVALRRVVSPSASASAIARAEAVRFSMLELAADSDLSSTEENGAISSPTGVESGDLMLASSASASTPAGSTTSKSAIAAGIAASYLPARRCAARTSASP